MNDKDTTRDRVRELVRQVLENTPLAEESVPEATPQPASTKFVDVAPPSQPAVKEFDRDESAKSLITEDDLRGLEPGSRLRVAENARFTPLASDLIQERRIELLKKSSRRGSGKVRTIAVGADHGGFEFKEQLRDYLEKQGFAVRDFGTNSEDAVDYPDFAHAVARAVSEKAADVGIIIDGAGIGSAMTANKVSGVRAAACYNAALARNSREHNGANVLTLGSKQNSFKEICEIAEAWLSTDLTEERHQKRVAKIDAVERQYQR
ncbi:MAG TPA: ribose 5-phosphate isomerase B [Pyrinomonadaceae bacterium]|nr:ribose 5-phosphate isomerase B [Pyrinomonadaceae bacterium]